MQYLIFLILIISFSGCGRDDSSSSSEPVPLIVGQFFLESGRCGVGLWFMADASYQSIRVCIDLDETVYSQVRAGTYEADEAAGLLTNTVLRSSCPSDRKATFENNFEVDAESLSMLYSDGRMNFYRIDETEESEDSGSVVEYGCFDEDGVFTKHAVKTLKP